MARSILLDSKPIKKMRHLGMPLVKWTDGNNLKLIRQHTLFILGKYEAFIWNLCNGKNSVNQIINTFCKKFQFGRKDAKKSILTFISQLNSKGLIRLKQK